VGELTLLENATVRTMVPATPLAEAVAFRDGRIAAVGTADELRGLRAEAARVVDLGGRTVLPGFIDPHAHFSVAALEGAWADCRALGTIPAIQAALRAAARATPPGAWVRGVGYHHARLAERRHPTREELDEAVPDRPALLVHFSYHQAVANSRALAAAAITARTPDPPGGAIARGRAGEPTGLLYERAMAPVEAVSRAAWEAHFVEAAAAASRRFAAVGLTMVEDAAVGPAVERRYVEAEAAGALAIRVGRMVVPDAGWFEPPWAEARSRGDGRTLKVFADGGYRCAMRLPRQGGEVRTGFLFYEAAELAALLVTAWRSGWRVTCHAIGNAGVETAVTAAEAALREEPAGAGRLRLDHAIFVTPALLARIADLGLPVVGQPSFLYDQGAPPSPLPGDLRCRPFRGVAAAGIRQAFSSDHPCGSLAPLTGIYAAVTRRDREGRVVDADEAVPVAAALAAYTIEAARVAGVGDEAGSVAVGKRADLVVLDADPLAVPPERLRDVRVVETLVGGRRAWP